MLALRPRSAATMSGYLIRRIESSRITLHIGRKSRAGRAAPRRVTWRNSRTSQVRSSPSGVFSMTGAVPTRHGSSAALARRQGVSETGSDLTADDLARAPNGYQRAPICGDQHARHLRRRRRPCEAWRRLGRRRGSMPSSSSTRPWPIELDRAAGRLSAIRHPVAVEPERHAVEPGVDGRQRLSREVLRVQDDHVAGPSRRQTYITPAVVLRRIQCARHETGSSVARSGP